jgi:RNA polymerase sigma-70 factor (ECF subfamily)
MSTPTFREVYDAHFRFVWRSLRRLGLREQEAEDALQEVFVVVHRKLGEFEGRSKITTWLFSICMRVAKDAKNRAHVRRHVPDADVGERADDTSTDPATQAELRERAAILESILESMPIEQRAVFSLYELDGMRGEDIAELCDVPLGTVYSRLRLAREHFQRAVARLDAKDRFRTAGRKGD